MAPKRARGEAERTFAALLPTTVADMRRRLGWTQAELGARAGTSQSQVSRFEGRRIEVVSLSTAAAFLDCMGIRPSLTLDHPLVSRSDRQWDAAHARCLAYVAGRIERMGWDVEREVEIHHGRSHGWIDVFAFHPPTRSALVVEVKSAIPDMGAIQRTLGWSTRTAWDLGRKFGWPIRRVGASLLVLATEANELRLADNAALTREAFPGAIGGSLRLAGGAGGRPPRRCSRAHRSALAPPSLAHRDCDRRPAHTASVRELG